jgi:hypothetical protein
MERLMDELLTGPIEACLGKSRQLRQPSTVKEFLNKIGHDHSAAAAQMHTIGMKLPAVHPRNLIWSPAKDQCAEGVAIDRDKSEPGESLTRGFPELRQHRFIDCDITCALAMPNSLMIWMSCAMRRFTSH